MTNDSLRVFLSYTSELDKYPDAMQSYIAAARRAVARHGHAFTSMDHFPPESERPENVSSREVSKCDVYVGVIGKLYGSPVPGYRPKKSFVELELETAADKALPRILLLLDLDANLGFPGRLRDNDKANRRLRALRDRVASEYTVKFVRDPHDLESALDLALRNLPKPIVPDDLGSIGSSDENLSGTGGDLVDPKEFDHASGTQRDQARRLLKLIDIHSEDDVLDVGCGTGGLAIDVAQRFGPKSVLGIDRMADMVVSAREKAKEARARNIEFETWDLLEFNSETGFDVIVSSHTMHWITPSEVAYARLFTLLRPGGRLAVHQGGYGTYKGLFDCASAIVADMSLARFFDNWEYPLYYPSVGEYRKLLQSQGFEDIEITSASTRGTEYPTLARDFAYAGLHPFLKRIPPETRKEFRARFIARAESTDVDRSAHNLFTVAKRPTNRGG